MATLSALQSFGFFWNPAAKATHLQELPGHFRSRLSPDAQNRAFAKNESCNQILDITLHVSQSYFFIFKSHFFLIWYQVFKEIFNLIQSTFRLKTKLVLTSIRFQKNWKTHSLLGMLIIFRIYQCKPSKKQV